MYNTYKKWTKNKMQKRRKKNNDEEYVCDVFGACDVPVIVIKRPTMS